MAMTPLQAARERAGLSVAQLADRAASTRAENANKAGAFF